MIFVFHIFGPENEVERAERPDCPHAVVHDFVPVLAAEDLEDRDEPPDERVEVVSRSALAHAVDGASRARPGLDGPRFLWQPRVRGCRVVLRRDCKSGVPIEEELSGEELLSHQSEDDYHDEQQQPGGSVRGERANFTRLVLGCIEAKFCK